MSQPEAKKSSNVFGKVATTVDSFFARHFYKLGLFVGTRPFTSIALTMSFCVLCMAGFSQMNVESRGEKLWIPQGTTAQDDAATFNSYFPPLSRMEMVLLETKGGSIVDKQSLTAAMGLFDELAKTKAGNDTLTTLCVPQPGNGHPCFINSILMLWNFNAQTLKADANPLATINAAGKTQEDLNRMLGGAVFDANGKVVSAKALTMSYFLQSNRERKGGSYDDPRGEAWEEEFLKTLKCDTPDCDGDVCSCGYSSPMFTVHGNAQRSRSDVFGGAIQGDVGLINAAFLIMIIYLTLNLGGVCHKVKSRALLALGCVFSIVVAGGAGYGLAMWFQFDYTPVMSVMPFVLLGIGVDDSFVIMNALDRVDSSLPVNQRIAHAISHAGVSIMVTSMTDFVAFAISASSALPALGAFCMFAAMSILMLFVLQVTVFTAFATFDTRRVDSNMIDCCPCICRRGCPCCPVVPADEAIKDGRDQNQLLCVPSKHQGGRFGGLLEYYVAPILVKTPVAIAVVMTAVGFCAICAWQMSMLPVEDAAPKFIPDDSYVWTANQKMDVYFGTLGQSVSIVTESGDYFAAQAALSSIGSRLSALSYMSAATSDSFESWAESYKLALKTGASAVGVAVTLDANGNAATATEYFTGLKTWLSGKGARFAKDVVWNNKMDPQKGIRATRISAELKAFNKVVDDKLVVDSAKAVEVMDSLREAVGAWSDMPGGKAFAYTYQFLSWEVFRIIRKEMFLNVGLCMVAVAVITLVFLAHPVASGLVLLTVAMTVVDILGCMNMWGLAIDNVSVIQVVIAIGLSVDYSAHIGHSFMTKAGSRVERVIATLGDVGSAVFNGGLSTFFAVMLLALSKSYVFRVLFQTFFLTVVLGLAHGMIVLPACLSLFGPAAYEGRIAAEEEGKVQVVDIEKVGEQPRVLGAATDAEMKIEG